MRIKALTFMIGLSLVLTGCNSRLNPLNLFRGESRESDVLLAERNIDTEGRPLMAQIIALSVEPTPGGAILTATGLPPQQGFFDGALVEIDAQAEGQLEFEFRAQPPSEPRRVGTQQSREVIVGTFLSETTLRSASQIRVSAAANARSISR